MSLQMKAVVFWHLPLVRRRQAAVAVYVCLQARRAHLALAPFVLLLVPLVVVLAVTYA